MYSQSNEEEVILKYFGDYIGTFMDLGSNDGKTLSNTYELSERGWKGVCVEPSPRVFDKLEVNHSLHNNVHCYLVAVSDYNGLADFYESGEHLKKGDRALLSTLNKNELKKWNNSVDFRLMQIEVITVERLLLNSKYKKFNFISIDCEGEDWKILKQINLGELECKCICIEHNSDPFILDSFVQYCGSFGLKKNLLMNAENVVLAI